MEKILTQKEIDALVRAAQGSRLVSAAEVPIQQIASFDINQAGRINKNQVQAVSMLHETFARNLGHSLGASLRVGIEVNLVSVEQLAYMEFQQRLPEISYLAAVGLRPMGARSAIQIDPSLAFPVIDLLLGGRGKPESEIREITEIESQILESVIGILCRELQVAWQPLVDLQFSFEQRLQQAQILQLMPPNERALSLIFEVHTPETRGLIHLVFPTQVSNALLRKLSQQWSYQKGRSVTETDSKLRDQLLDCLFSVELVLPSTSLQADTLADLKVVQVLRLPLSVDQPALLQVGGKKMFSAFPVRCNHARGAQIHQRLTISGSTGKDLS